VTTSCDLAMPGAVVKAEITLTVFDGLESDKHPQATPVKARKRFSIISRQEFAYCLCRHLSSTATSQGKAPSVVRGWWFALWFAGFFHLLRANLQICQRTKMSSGK